MVPSECGGLREKRFRQSAALLAKGGIRLFWLPGFLILALWCPRTAVYKVCLKEQAKGKGHLSLPGANLETTCQKMPLVSRKRGVRDQSLPGDTQKSYPRPRALSRKGKGSFVSFSPKKVRTSHFCTSKLRYSLGAIDHGGGESLCRASHRAMIKDHVSI